MIPSAPWLLMRTGELDLLLTDCGTWENGPVPSLDSTVELSVVEEAWMSGLQRGERELTQLQHLGEWAPCLNWTAQ